MSDASSIVTMAGADLYALVAHVIDELTSRPPIVCVHLHKGGQVALVCAAHPAAGVSCFDCYRAHADRHTVELEHTCDRCHRVVDKINGVLVPLSGIAPARTTRGHGLFLGAVNVGSIGLCSWCNVSVRQRANAVAS